jgi:hypothetical protein
VEAIAGAFDVMRTFAPHRPVPALSEVAAGSGLAGRRGRRRGRSVARPRGNRAARIFTSMNVTVPAAETSVATADRRVQAAAAGDHRQG